MKNSERVFESSVSCTRVDASRQAELSDVPQSLKFGGVDDCTDPRGERHILPGWNADDRPARLKVAEFGDGTVGMSHVFRILLISTSSPPVAGETFGSRNGERLGRFTLRRHTHSL
jgi:hypothetical protein